ncbi:MAG: SDR family oxidoreductase [Calditrichaeota bacterium]|nr:MAG: SDR family NAD(P)-dependent oxidoreductase [Calditrichota bacterium]MBL1205990.1 SDR family oxidoreductase [Calditrichota bacterium]NOG45818.1 SDR family oxidoreductase [Calditrichota bacterium]
MDLEINNKVAVVFAASKGLGKAAALSLANEGCKVAICSRDADKIKQAAKDISGISGTDVYSEAVDVENKIQIDSFIENVAQKWGTIDILVNNAGGPPVASFEQSQDDEWQKWYNITFMSVVRAIKAALPYLKQNNWGRIINITSSSVKSPIENLVYSNSIRLAVVGLAKTLSLDLGRFGITVHNVAPGYHLTDGLERIIDNKVEHGQKREDVLKSWSENIPLGKIGEPQDLASLVAFLASGKAGYMSGTTIQVDGGLYPGTL